MKRIGLTLCLVCFGFLLAGQTNQTASTRKTVTGMYHINKVHGSEDGGMVMRGMDFSFHDSAHDSVISCRGECELKVGTMLLQAGEVDFHARTGEAEARENVRIKVLPVRAGPECPTGKRAQPSCIPDLRARGTMPLWAIGLRLKCSFGRSSCDGDCAALCPGSRHSLDHHPVLFCPAGQRI